MIDTRQLVQRLKALESIAIIPRVSSTNLIARRIVTECIENELSLPQAMIIAREQFAGRGRNDRTWSSPPGKGIYATTLLTRGVAELALFPLEMANIVASFAHDVFGIDARVKWPNDILAGGRKLAGILIEARVQDERAFLIIGVGVNVEPAPNDDRPNAVSLTELSERAQVGLDAATSAFIEHVDERLARPLDRERVLREWRSRSVHRAGDRIVCAIGERSITGTWAGIDDDGRALLRSGADTIPISAGDLICS